jgi:LCP family protein required for cell wall assembly
VSAPPRDEPSPTHADATYYTVPRRRRPVFAGVAWALLVIVGVGVAGLLYGVRLAERALSNDANNATEVKETRRVLAEPPKNLPDRPINILLIGSDTRGKKGSGGLSDTLILARLDFKRNFISMLSFPRDLFVTIPGYGQNKINAAYSFGSNTKAIETVKLLTGEPIHYFFNVDFEAFRRLVNDVDGVFLDVDRWYFNDRSGFERVDIKPGYQNLSGSEALDYVRYRKGDGDLARAARQQAFLSELKRESKNARGLDNIVDAINAEVTTSLDDAGRLLKFLQFGLGIENERIARVTVGTSGGGSTSCCGSVLYTSPGLVADAVDRWKNPEFISEGPATTLPPAKVKVVVYNGSNRLRLGSQVGRALQARGYQVAFGGNAPDGTFQSTAILYRAGKRNEAKALQVLFGDRASIVQRAAGQPADGDVSVMVGVDYDGLRTPRRTATAREKPETVATTSLRRIVQNAKAVTGMDLLVPTHLPPGSEVRYVRLYNVERGSRGKPNALTIVVRLRGNSSLGGNRYVSITQTSMKDPPIVATGICCDKQKNVTFYNGKRMQRLLWQRGGMTYWVSNSLDDALSVATMRDIRQYMVRPARAKLKAGQTDTRIPIQERGSTP